MDPNKISDTKKFALETLEIFNELAQPEIKNAIMQKVWGFVKNRTFQIILRKPDEEIQEKLIKIQKQLNKKFSDLDMSVEINESEQKFNSVPIPDVGELAKIKKIVAAPKNEDLLEELGF